MKSIFSRVLCLFVTLIMIIGLFPTSVFAIVLTEEDYTIDTSECTSTVNAPEGYVPRNDDNANKIYEWYESIVPVGEEPY